MPNEIRVHLGQAFYYVDGKCTAIGKRTRQSDDSLIKDLERGLRDGYFRKLKMDASNTVIKKV